jgi:hypothetical protein
MSLRVAMWENGKYAVRSLNTSLPEGNAVLDKSCLRKECQ